jgi:hypothetical protein
MGALPPAFARDVTLLLDETFVTSLEQFPCDGTRQTWTPFFPGLQKFDDDPRAPLLTSLGGDAAVANLYTRYAAQAVDRGNIRNWILLNYHNRADLSSNPGPIAAGGDLLNLYRANRATRLNATRNADQSIREWGDFEQMRMLNLWLASSEERFRAHAPEYARGRNPARDENDFALYYRDVVTTQAWVDYVTTAAWHTGVALKCHIPIFAHSGGGVPMLFLLRLLGLSPRLDVARWLGETPLPIVGLEAVMSNESVDAVRSIPGFGSLAISNYVVDTVLGGHAGSSVMQRLIVDELTLEGHHAFVTGGVRGERLFNFLGGHANIGFYVLRYGELPRVSFETGNSP